MSGVGLMIAAHGSRTEPGVNQQIRRMAAGIPERGPFDEVTCAFHQGEPGFAAALDAMRSQRVVVVPLMTSNGHYANTVLPGALAQAERATHVAIKQTQAVGGHRDVPRLLCDRAVELISRFDLDATTTTVVIVGHGTPRHRQSRATTMRCVDALAERRVVGAVRLAFLDDEPEIEAVARSIIDGNVMIMPFLIGRGLHGAIDIADRFGLKVSQTEVPPLERKVGGCRIVLDVPVGHLPNIVDLVMDLAHEAQRQLEQVQA